MSDRHQIRKKMVIILHFIFYGIVIMKLTLKTNLIPDIAQGNIVKIDYV